MDTLIVNQDIKVTPSDIGVLSKKRKVIFFYICVWIFVLGCLIGYAVEVAYSYFTSGSFHNKQGMIYGPFNQVYGFGAVVFTVSLYKFRNARKPILFLAGSLVGGVFEYICSYIQEVVFKSESWNYTTLPLSFNGRTNPMHAMFWGALGVLFFTFVLPPFTNLMSKIPTRVTVIISWFLFIFMLLNMAISSAAVIRQTQRRNGDKADNVIEEFLDKHYDDEMLKKVYPNMKFISKK